MGGWPGIGMNYGHQVTPNSYDAAQVESDFTFLRNQGITRIRIAYPGYVSQASLGYCKDMVVRALAHGFYVVWGVSTGRGLGSLTSTVWGDYKSVLINTHASWAQSVGLSEFSLGNEVELQADGTTLTAATVRSDVRSMSPTVKTNGFTGKVSYHSTIEFAQRTAWISEGIGLLDQIGWNSYGTYSQFDTRNGQIVAAFGNKTYISEFGSMGHGYPDFNDEQAFYSDTVNRINSMQAAGISAGYFFCYRDGSFGVPSNSFGLIETDGSVHFARKAVCGA